MATSNDNRNYSNYPNGFDGGVLIQELLGFEPVASKIFWVGNNPVIQNNEKQQSDSNKGTFHSPFATIDFAIGQCSANNNNVIIVREGYTETISAASGITCDVVGIYIVGTGQGANRPTITFDTATTASIVISAANTTIKNIIGLTGFDALTNPFDVQAADCTLDIEWQDASSTVEAERVVLTTAAADGLKVKLKYLGFTAGNATVNAVRLVGCDNGEIDVDFYGIASTAVVEFSTTACTNIKVSGYFYNSGTTDLSKNVIDTQGSSTWFVKGTDGAAGADFSGGSALGVAKVTNSVLGTRVTKAPATLPASTTDNLFTIAGGRVLITKFVGEVTTIVEVQACNTKVNNNPTVGTTVILATNVDITGAEAGATFTVEGDATALVIGLGGTSLGILGGMNLEVAEGALELETAATNTGATKWELWYIPLDDGATVVAA